jgi:molybdopterin molybdotransferase
MTAGTATGAAEADGSPWTVEAYQSAVLSAITPLAPVRLELAAAEGCVLAEDVTAAVALPSFDNSSMDGYAVRAADVAGAPQQAPPRRSRWRVRSRRATPALTGWPPARSSRS